MPGAAIDAHRHFDHEIVYAGRGVLAVTTSTGTWIAPGTRAIWALTELLRQAVSKAGPHDGLRVGQGLPDRKREMQAA